MVLVLASGRRIHERDLACNKQLDGLPDVRFGSVGIHFDAALVKRMNGGMPMSAARMPSNPSPIAKSMAPYRLSLEFYRQWR